MTQNQNRFNYIFWDKNLQLRRLQFRHKQYSRLNCIFGVQVLRRRRRQSLDRFERREKEGVGGAAVWRVRDPHKRNSKKMKNSSGLVFCTSFKKVILSSLLSLTTMRQSSFLLIFGQAKNCRQYCRQYFLKIVSTGFSS